jgi:1-acyl-sn-glycerol-3-phosphate acyltransferase
MAINNSDKVFENHLPFIKSTRMIIEFCEPIDVAAMDKEQRKALATMTHDIILETYERNQRELDAKG